MLAARLARKKNRTHHERYTYLKLYYKRKYFNAKIWRPGIKQLLSKDLSLYGFYCINFNKEGTSVSPELHILWKQVERKVYICVTHLLDWNTFFLSFILIFYSNALLDSVDSWKNWRSFLFEVYAFKSHKNYVGLRHGRSRSGTKLSPGVWIWMIRGRHSLYEPSQLS